MEETGKQNGLVIIKDLFARYSKNLIPPQKIVINTFCEVVFDIYQLKIDTKKVNYNPQTRVLILKQSGPLKTEILLKKPEILNHLKGRLGVEKCPQEII